MMSSSRQGRVRTAVVHGLLALALLGAASSAAATSIDAFNATTQTASDSARTSQASVPGTDVLGTERDLYVTRLSGGGAVTATVVPATPALDLTSAAGTNGQVLITWDGTDGAADVVSTTPGLGNQSLSGSGLRVRVASATAGSVLVAEVFSTAGTSSVQTVVLPLISSTQDIVMPFSMFAPRLGGGAVFTSVNAITLLVRTKGGAGSSTVSITAVDTVATAATVTATNASNPALAEQNVNGSAAPDPGDRIQYTITVTNTGTEKANTVAAIDPLDTHTTAEPANSFFSSSPVAFDDYVFGSVAPLTGNVITNDIDPDGGAKTVFGGPLAVTGSAGGTGTVQANGTFSFTPGVAAGDYETFTYELDDPDGDRSTGVVTVRIDDPAPTVTATTPANGVLNVSASTTIVVDFSEPVTIAAPASAFVLQCPSGSGNIAYASVTPTLGNTRWTLTPSSSLPLGQLCTMTVVAAQVADSDSFDPPDTMAADYVFTFGVPPSVAGEDYPDTLVGNVSVDSAARGPSFSVTTNDTLGGGTLTTGALTSLNGGAVNLNADGTFTYDPPVGFNGTIAGATEDRFTYTVTSAGGNATGTVKIGVSGKIWFVNNQSGCTVDCNGRLSHPFTSIDALRAANGGGAGKPGINDPIFFYESATPYAGTGGVAASLTLVSGQKVIGQDATQSLSTLTGLTPPSGSPALPAMNTGAPATTLGGTGPAMNALVLGSGNFLYGFTGGDAPGGRSLTGASVGTLTVQDVTLNNPSGNALTLNGAIFAAGSAFTGISSSGAAIAISLSTVVVAGGGTVTFGNGSLNGSTSAAISISGGSAGTITYSGNISVTTGLVATVTGGHAGTLTLLGGTLSATGGTGLLFDNADGVYNFNGTTTLNGGTARVVIQNGSGGTFSFGSATTITSPAATAFSLNGGTAAVTYNGSISQAQPFPLLEILGGHATGNVRFQSGTFSATNGTGLQFTDADGTYQVLGVMTLNGGDAGVDIAAASNGTINITNTGSSITNPTGTAFDVTGGNAIVGYSGSISKASGRAVSVTNRTGFNSVTFPGPVSVTGASGAGTSGPAIVVSGPTANGLVGFSGAVNLGGTNPLGGGTVVLIDNNNQAGAAVTFTTLNCAATGQTCLGVVNGGGIQTTAGTVTSDSAAVALLGGTGAVTANVVLTATTSTGGANQIRLVNMSGSANFGNTTLTGTLPGSDAVSISGTVGSNGSITFGNASGNIAGQISISGKTGGTVAFTRQVTVGPVIIDSNTGGAINFTGGVNLSTGTATAFSVNANNGSVSASGGTTAITTSTGTGLNVTGGSGSVTLVGSITVTAAGRPLSVTSKTGGTIQLNGPVTATASGTSQGVNFSGNTGTTLALASALAVSSGANTAFTWVGPGTLVLNGSTNTLASTTATAFSATGGGTLNLFGSTTNSITASTGTALVLNGVTVNALVSGLSVSTSSTGTGVSVTGGTVTIDASTSANGFVINNTTGQGLVATGGTLTVKGTKNTITTTTATALNVTSTTIGAAGLNFKSISANGAGSGIILNGTGAGGLTVSGDGATSGGFLVRNGTGGTLNAISGNAVSLTDANNVTLRQMNVTNTGAGGDGVNSTRGSNIVLSAMNFDTLGHQGWAALDLGGVSRVDNNCRFATWNAINANAVVVTNNSDSGFTSFTVDRSLFTTSVTGANGFLFDGNGDTAGTVTVTNSEFTLIDQDAVQINNDGTGDLTAVVQANDFHDADATSGDGNNTLVLSNAGSGDLNFTVGGVGAFGTPGGLGNRFLNLGRLTCACGVAQVNSTTTNQTGTRIIGTFKDNTITNSPGRRGIDVVIAANQGSHGGHDVTIDGNVMTGTQSMGINVLVTSVSGGASTSNKFRIINNTVTMTSAGGTADSGTALEFETNDGNANGAISNDVLIQNNQLTNNNTSGVGETLEVTNRAVNAGTTSTMNLTIWGNTFTNSQATGQVFEVLASGASGTQSLCVDMNGANVVGRANNFTGTPPNGFKLSNDYGTFAVGAMSSGAQSPANVQAFVSPRNNNKTVTAAGGLATFVGGSFCTLP